MFDETWLDYLGADELSFNKIFAILGAAVVDSFNLLNDLRFDHKII